MFFMPNLIGGLILGYIWQFIFTDVFNFIGDKTGLHHIFFNWLLDPQYALYAMVIVFTWQMGGYTMIIYIAGLQGIPDEMLEAARVDGANLWHRLTKIIFPLLMPAFTICLFLTLSGAFKIFDVNLSLTKGGPNNATEMFAMNIYNEIFGYSHYGIGQAKAIVFFLVVALITLTQVIITKRREVQM
jgi:raffinose/stachyose/melibiose transport system permease protein